MKNNYWLIFFARLKKFVRGHKLASSALAILLVATVAYAAGFERIPKDTLKLGTGNASNKTIEFDKGSSPNNPLIRWNNTSSALEFTNDGINFLEIGSGSGGGSGINLLTNPGCETGTSTPDDWTASGGTLTRTTTAGEVGYGEASCKWDANASSQTLHAGNVEVPNILENTPCLASFRYLAETITGGDYSLKVELDDGTDLTSELALQPTNGAWRQILISFQCPTNDSVRFVVESEVSDPAAILIDQAHLGSMNNEFLAGDPAEVVFSGFFATTASCTWPRTNAALGPFTTTAACPAITVVKSSPTVTVNGADTDLPQVVFSSLPPGDYMATATFQGSTSSEPVSGQFSMFDGTNHIAHLGTQNSATTDLNPMTLQGFFTHSGGAKTLSINCAMASGTCNIENGSQGRQLRWHVVRYSKETSSKITLETQGWNINADWGATANTSLGVSAVTTFTSVNGADGSLVLNSGSFPAEVPCTGGNAPTGLTCSAGSEVVGVAFTPPYQGKFIACVNGSWEGINDVGDALYPVFRLLVTDATNEGTVIHTGVTRLSVGFTGVGGNEPNVTPVGMCEYFEISSLTKKAVRLQYVQNIAAAPDSSVLYTDRAGSSSGSRSINFLIFPATQNFPQAIALTSLPNTTDLSDSLATKYGYYQYDHGGGPYNSGLAPTVTGTSSWTTNFGYFVPFQTKDGRWRMRINIGGGTSSTSNVTVSIVGVVFKAGTNFEQNVSVGNQSSGSNPGHGVTVVNANQLAISQPASVGTWRIHGEVLLESKPTWAF